METSTNPLLASDILDKALRKFQLIIPWKSLIKPCGNPQYFENPKHLGNLKTPTNPLLASDVLDKALRKFRLIIRWKSLIKTCGNPLIERLGNPRNNTLETLDETPWKLWAKYLRNP